jgi:MoxR-like ATPase
MVQTSRHLVEALIKIRREVALESESLPPLEDIARELNSRVTPKQNWRDLSQVDELLQRSKEVEDFRREREATGLTKLTALDQSIKQLDKDFLQLAEKVSRDRRPYTRAELAQREDLLREKSNAEIEKTSTLAVDADAFMAYHGHAFNRYAEELRTGKLVQTPYVTDKLNQLLTTLRRNYYSLLHGDTGSGKTEVAKLAGRIFSKEIHSNNPPGGSHEPLLIRCYRGMGAEELFGHFALKGSQEISIGDLPERIEAEIDAWNKKYPLVSDQQRQDAAQKITEAMLRQSGCTISEFIFGAVYRAAKEGRVVILDEVNFAPPEMLVKLNEFLNLGPGELVNIQEDAIEAFPMHKGFGLICTGNIDYGSTKRYGSGRFDFEPSRLNRLTLIAYDYLPQAIKGTYQEIIDPLEKQLFTIALASLVGDASIATLPREALKRIWGLCKYARLTQIAFSGQLKRSNEFALQSGGAPIEYSPEVLISPRNLVRILKDWSLDGFRFELDHYVYQHFICSAIKPADGALLYQLAKKLDFFQQGWPAGIAELEKLGAGPFLVRDPLNEGPELRYYHREEILTAVYGDGPARRDAFESSEEAKHEASGQERLDIANELLIFEELRSKATAALDFLQGNKSPVGV